MLVSVYRTSCLWVVYSIMMSCGDGLVSAGGVSSTSTLFVELEAETT